MLKMKKNIVIKYLSKQKKAQTIIWALGDRTGTRTPNLQLRRLLLYPVELCDQVFFYVFYGGAKL